MISMAVLDLQALETSAAEAQLPGSTVSNNC
ncbi:class III lanthipeptide [Prauserella alba]|nr:class III lanthipeptide [Prauserella alba]